MVTGHGSSSYVNYYGTHTCKFVFTYVEPE